MRTGSAALILRVSGLTVRGAAKAELAKGHLADSPGDRDGCGLELVFLIGKLKILKELITFIMKTKKA